MNVCRMKEIEETVAMQNQDVTSLKNTMELARKTINVQREEISTYTAQIEKLNVDLDEAKKQATHYSALVKLEKELLHGE